MKKDKITYFGKGMNMDNSSINQPEGTYRFALNSVIDNDEGDISFLSNENSNKPFTQIKNGYIPIGKCYIGDNETVLFLVSENNKNSEIGILKENGEYNTIVNDYNSPSKQKLNFKKENQIQCVYRLRRGCEKTIYFTGKDYPPRYFNFNLQNEFKTSDGKWDRNKFNLFKTSSKIPLLQNVEVVDGGGSLAPGSYTVFFQYLDSDFNATNFIEIISNIYIYDSPLNMDFSDIEGNVNFNSKNFENIEGISNFQTLKTNKSIKLHVSNLDKNYAYYRLAFVEYTESINKVSNVKYTNYISTETPFFTYTGTNANTEGSLEEVLMFNLNTDIESASHIEQLENRLILANTSSLKLNEYLLQQYASKISADCLVKKIDLTDIDNKHNMKNPLVSYNGIGYQPGEVYSFGIVYIYSDGTYSPAFHIPGKAEGKSLRDKVYNTSKNNLYPMSNKKNINISESYSSNTICKELDYWGKDVENNNLLNTRVRHHRFPTRQELGVPLVEKVIVENNVEELLELRLSVDYENLKKSIQCNGQPNCIDYTAKTFQLRLQYSTKNSTHFSDILYVNPDDINTHITLKIEKFNINNLPYNIKLLYSEDFTNTSSSQIEIDTTLENVPQNTLNIEEYENGKRNETSVQDNGAKYYYYFSKYSKELKSNFKYYGYILGINFSNIEIPNNSKEIIGKEIIGYQIVRLDRKEEDETIVDSGVILPAVNANNNMISCGLVAPEVSDKLYSIFGFIFDHKEFRPYSYDNHISKNTGVVLTLGNKFTNKVPNNFTHIEQDGEFVRNYKSLNGFKLENVVEGSSAEGVNTSKPTSDNNGMALKHLVRFSGVDYVNENSNGKLNITKDKVRLTNLQPFNSITHINGRDEIFNMSMDNSQLIINTYNDSLQNSYKNYRYPYVYFKKDSSSFYQNFRNRDYKLVSNKIFIENDTDVFGGDCYITPFRYSNHIYMNAIAGHRASKINVFKIIGSILTIGLGIIAMIIPGLQGLGSLLMIAGGSLLAAGGILLGASAIIEKEKFDKVYSEKWEKGLDKGLYDADIHHYFKNYQKLTSQMLYDDDCINWMGEVIGDFWFESKYNNSLRVSPLEHLNNFLKPLKNYMIDNSQGKNALSHGTKVRSHKIHFNTPPDGYNVREGFVEPNDEFTRYFYNKIFNFNATENSKYKYTGLSLPVIYLLNADYNQNTKLKNFRQIPLEYNFCSECANFFPHRVYYSNQSFQEEKSDNYKIFLPNNYRDIEGETGKITNIFKFNNDLFIHTEEALWKLPKNYQERVVGEIVSYIGTGDFFSLPPQKIIDDESGMSSGCTNKWGTSKNPYGYFYVCEKEGKIIKFDGKQLHNLSLLGMTNWFRDNLRLKENHDNPSYRNGFLISYDSELERLLITKKEHENSIDSSWTLSFSLRYDMWVSFHSYMPRFYINTHKEFITWHDSNNYLWKHNVKGNYQTYYTELKPFIIDYSSPSSGLQTSITDSVNLYLRTRKLDENNNYYDVNEFFNKVIFYNSNQCSGLLNIVKKEEVNNYMFNQFNNLNTDEILVDKNERDWSINEIRDIRVNYNSPIWLYNKQELQNQYFIDKVLNTVSLDYSKHWSEMESFRDKFINIRFIFDKFADIKFILNTSNENENISIR